MLNGKTAVFFDADGTLIDHKACEKQALQYVFKELGLRYEEAYQGIFREMESELWANAESGLIPHNDFFSDSLQNDIQGAINAGIQSVWFNPDSIKNTTGIQPDYEISSVSELKV